MNWLQDQAEFRSLTERADRLLSLQSDLRRCAPGLALAALGQEGEELLVGTPNAATAAKLRQLAPSIARALQDRGWQIKRIRFRPQPGIFGRPAAPLRIKDPIPAATLEVFEALAAQAESPGLAQALAHLVSEQRKRR